jgi:hypothetical protein
MSWTPEEIDNLSSPNSSWTPNEIENLDKNNQVSANPSIWQSLLNAGMGSVNRINNLGGGFVNNAFQGLTDVANIAPNIISGRDLFKAPQAPFVDPNAQSTKLGNIGGDVASAVATYEALPALKALKKLAPMIKGFISGAATAPQGERTESGLVGGTIGAGIGFGTSAINGFKSLARILRGQNAQEPMDALADDEFKGNDVTTHNNENGKMVADTFDDIRRPISQAYEKFKQDVPGRGYFPDFGKSYPGISLDTEEREINIGKDTQQNLEKLASEDIDPSAIGRSLKKSVNDFLDNPSFQNAHDLQTELGNKWAKLNAKPDKTGFDQDALDILRPARPQLIQDIHDSFINNGDFDLFKRYKDLSDEWENKVVPFQKAGSLWQWLENDKNIPANISKVLSQENTNEDFSKVLDLIKQQNPDLAHKIGMQSVLKGAATRDLNGNYHTDVDKVIDNFSNMPQSLRDVLNPNIADQMSQISQAKNLSNNLRKYGKLGLKAGGVGAGAFGAKKFYDLGTSAVNTIGEANQPST